MGCIGDPGHSSGCAGFVDVIVKKGESIMTDQILELSDGRRLGYAEYGDPEDTVAIAITDNVRHNRIAISSKAEAVLNKTKSGYSGQP